MLGIQEAWIGAKFAPIACEGTYDRHPVRTSVLFGLTGAGFGAAIGALVGSCVRYERWELMSISVSLAPGRKGDVAALSLRF